VRSQRKKFETPDPAALEGSASPMEQRTISRLEELEEEKGNAMESSEQPSRPGGPVRILIRGGRDYFAEAQSTGPMCGLSEWKRRSRTTKTLEASPKRAHAPCPCREGRGHRVKLAGLAARDESWTEFRTKLRKMWWAPRSPPHYSDGAPEEDLDLSTQGVFDDWRPSNIIGARAKGGANPSGRIEERRSSGERKALAFGFGDIFRGPRPLPNPNWVHRNLRNPGSGLGSDLRRLLAERLPGDRSRSVRVRHRRSAERRLAAPGGRVIRIEATARANRGIAARRGRPFGLCEVVAGLRKLPRKLAQR